MCLVLIWKLLLILISNFFFNKWLILFPVCLTQQTPKILIRFSSFFKFYCTCIYCLDLGGFASSVQLDLIWILQTLCIIFVWPGQLEDLLGQKENTWPCRLLFLIALIFERLVMCVSPQSYYVLYYELLLTQWLLIFPFVCSYMEHLKMWSSEAHAFISSRCMTSATAKVQHHTSPHFSSVF